MRRREVILALGGAAAWPLTARAQQPAMPVIGYLSSVSPGPFAPNLAAFRRGLSQTGFIEGHNVAIEYRWAEGHYDRLAVLANELVRRRVDVIVAAGGSGAAAKAATATIPIVTLSGGDPVEEGLVTNLNRPGGNITGVALFANSLGPKRFELLHELVPTSRLIAILANPTNASGNAQRKTVEAAARIIGQRIVVFEASSESEFEPAFAAMVQQRADAPLVMADPFFNSRREQLVALIGRHAIPAIYEWREFALAGGLMSYGSSISEAHRQTGLYAGQILKGTKPADLPFQQAVRVEFIINLKTAKALGLTFPITLLGRADEVIE
jgi:putative tryptophan/tyrosine transport system substrate-binding protein